MGEKKISNLKSQKKSTFEIWDLTFFFFVWRGCKKWPKYEVEDNTYQQPTFVSLTQYKACTLKSIDNQLPSNLVACLLPACTCLLPACSTMSSFYVPTLGSSSENIFHAEDMIVRITPAFEHPVMKFITVKYLVRFRLLIVFTGSFLFLCIFFFIGKFWSLWDRNRDRGSVVAGNTI